MTSVYSTSCVKIITGSAPEAGQHHGCPFKHFDERHLAKFMVGLNPKITSSDVDEIIDLCKQQHYQVCNHLYKMLILY